MPFFLLSYVSFLVMSILPFFREKGRHSLTKSVKELKCQETHDCAVSEPCQSHQGYETLTPNGTKDALKESINEVVGHCAFQHPCACRNQRSVFPTYSSQNLSYLIFNTHTVSPTTPKDPPHGGHVTFQPSSRQAGLPQLQPWC